MDNLTYLGHAGWLYEDEDIKCVFDPWNSNSGAFLDSWYPFPDNNNIDFKNTLKDLDFVYISHAHEDHLVENTLKLIDKNTKVLIAKFKDKTTLQKLLSFGFTNIIELTEDKVYEIKKAKIKIIKTEGFIENDSCLILNKGNCTILNLNDSHIDFYELKKNVNKVDVLLLQSSSAIWWPCNYEYENKIKDNYGKIKRNNLLRRALKYCQILKPKIAIPNAGPPLFKNRIMERWNFNRDQEWNPFCTSKEASEYFKKNNINSDFMVPGETINVSTLDIKRNEKLREEIYSEIDLYTDKYLKQIRANKHVIDINLPEHVVNKYFEKFKRQVKVISKISTIYSEKVDFKTLIEFSKKEKWILDLKNKTSPLENYTGQKYRYHFKINKNYLPYIMKEKNIDFERLFLSGNFSCKREPDIFNEFLFTILKNFDSKRLKTSEQIYAENSNMKDELFILNHKGCKYEVQKYCPHMYADLEKIGYIDEEENFVCPLHGWKFDVNSGICKNKNEKLKIKRIN